MQTDLPQELIAATERSLTIELASDTAGLQVQLKAIKVIKDKVEARKEEITKPLRAALSSARDLFLPLEIKLREADKRVRGALLELEAAREKEALKLARKVEQGKVSVEDSMALMVPESKGLFRFVQKLKIVSRKDIPDKYWEINEVALRADLMAGKKVKGAVLVKEQTVVSK